MRRSLQWKAIVLIGAVWLVGCANESTTEEPGAVSEAHSQEIEGTHDRAAPNPVTAQTSIDNVQIGRSVDSSGKIASSDPAEAFEPGDQVYLSMEVREASVGTEVQVSVVDATTGSEWWSDTKTVGSDEVTVIFEINTSDLESGEYRADVFVGDERVAQRSFEVA